jgi:hypothetical protein
MVSRLRPSDWAASRGESAKRSTAAIGLFGVVVILIATNLPPRHKMKTGVIIYYILRPVRDLGILQIRKLQSSAHKTEPFS